MHASKIVDETPGRHHLQVLPHPPWYERLGELELPEVATAPIGPGDRDDPKAGGQASDLAGEVLRREAPLTQPVGQRVGGREHVAARVHELPDEA